MTTTHALGPSPTVAPLPPPPLAVAPDVSPTPSPIAAPPSSPATPWASDTYQRASTSGPKASAVVAPKPAPLTPRPEVQEMQQALNAWRATQSLPALPENGLFDAPTRQAVVDFQRKTGLTPDGVYGVGTREMLALENSDGFKIFSASTQDEARRFMRSLGQDEGMLTRFRALASQSGFMVHIPAFVSPGYQKLDPDMRARVFDSVERSFSKTGKYTEARHLTSLVGSPAMSELSAGAVTKLVKAQLRHPGDDGLEASLGRIAGSSGFPALTPREKSYVVGTLAGRAGDRASLDDYASAVGMLHEFQPEARASILSALAAQRGPSGLATNVINLAIDPTFRAMDPATQLDVVQRVTGGSQSEHLAENLVGLTAQLRDEDARRAAAGLDPVPLAVRDEIFRGLETRYADAKLTPTQLSNIVGLGAAAGFEVLRPEVQRLILDVHAVRPENVQLTADLTALANDPSFRHDVRNAAKRIHAVDSAVP